MPAPASATEFVDLVRRSQLLPDARLDEVLTRHRLGGTLPSSVDQIANLLVREGLLTFFQAKQLKLGRYKRFTIGSKYRLLELIGAGGMGAVYLCEHTLMRRLVALKVLPVEKLDDPSNVERFYREARAVAALDHPNIVRAYDIDQYEKLHFLVMEYVDGTSLQEIVARYVLEKKPFDPIRAAHYIAQAAVGMQHGHELGMVHRDIKPGNLLLDRTGRDQGPRHGPGPVLQQAAGQRHREVRRQVRARHGRLPRPGAGRQQHGGHPRRHLRARRHALLHAHRPDAVPGRHDRGEARRAPDPRAAAGRVVPRRRARRACSRCCGR